MSESLNDLVTVIEWLAASKTATGEVAEALGRLREHTKERTPINVKLPQSKEPFRKEGDI